MPHSTASYAALESPQCDFSHSLLADRVETPLFGGDEVLRSFLRLAIRFVKDLSNAVMLDNALGLSK